MDSIRQRKQINPVAGIVADEVARSGVISFARFMELALYHLEHGYYRKSHIGKAGDFFTSVSVGPLFGQMLAYYLAKNVGHFGGELHLVEAGANDAALAGDILTWLNANRPEIAQRLRYFIVEPIPELQERQRERIRRLGAFASQVSWTASIDELPPVRGALISNELLDAFPVHVLRWKKYEERWREFGVGAGLRFVAMDVLPDWANGALCDLKPLEPYLPDNFTVEFSPSAEDWWRRGAAKLELGMMLAIDYGDESEGLWSPARADGTLRGFRNHKLVSNALADPGEQDITASVNFSRIRAAGESAGLVSHPLQSQAEFLTKIAAEFFSKPTAAQIRQFQTLTHPDHLGRAFKVLVQSRTNS